MPHMPIVDSQQEALTALDEICQVLRAHPDFRELPAARIARLSPIGMAIGRFVRHARARTFAAEFAHSLTLWRFELRQDHPRALAVDLRGQCEKLLNDWCVVIHFLDESGEIRFQSNYPLRGVLPDVLTFIYLRWLITVPAGVPPGSYYVRLGVCSQHDGPYLQLTQFRGCRRDPAGSWCNMIRLPAINIER